MEELSMAQKRQEKDMEVKFPSKTIVCRKCIFAKEGLLGFRNRYCDMFPRGKPLEILFEDANCEYYQASD